MPSGNIVHSRERMSSTEESECPGTKSSKDGVKTAEPPAYIAKLSRVPLVSHIIVLAMCVIYATISAFVKIVDTLDSWQIASHRKISQLSQSSSWHRSNSNSELRIDLNQNSLAESCDDLSVVVQLILAHVGLL